MHDESNRHKSIVIMVKKRSPIGPARQRPSKCMLDHAGSEFLSRNLPQFFEPKSIFLWACGRFKLVARDRLFRKGAAGALCKEQVLAPQFHAAREAGLRHAVPTDSHVSGRDADHLTLIPEQKLGRGEAGVDFDAEAFRARSEPPRD